MHKRRYSLLFTTIALLLGFATRAQDSVSDKNVDMAAGMRSNGKIYVVITVLVIILLGLITYVISLDKKIRKFEKDNRS